MFPRFLICSGLKSPQLLFTHLFRGVIFGNFFGVNSRAGEDVSLAVFQPVDVVAGVLFIDKRGVTCAGVPVGSVSKRGDPAFSFCKSSSAILNASSISDLSITSW